MGAPRPSWLPRGRDGGWDRAGHPAWFAPAVGPPAPGPLERLAEALAAGGAASLRYDPRGCGESGGDWAASSLFTRIDDARDAIGAMRSRRELDLRRTAIVGHGEGAVIAISVAIGDPAIGAVGLVGPPARSFRDVLRRGAAERERSGVRSRASLRCRPRPCRRGAHRTGAAAGAAMELRVGGASVSIELAAWEQAIHTPALALATMLHRHVVIAHGSRDAWAHPDESRLLATVLAEAGNQPVLQIVDGAGHDLAEAEGRPHRCVRRSARRRHGAARAAAGAGGDRGDDRRSEHDARLSDVTRLAAGDPAPDFSLAADDGSIVSSESLAGSRYVLYFYPKDDTPGCTAQACGLRDSWSRVTETGVQLFGVSPDSVKSHVKFREKYALPYRLLSD